MDCPWRLAASDRALELVVVLALVLVLALELALRRPADLVLADCCGRFATTGPCCTAMAMALARELVAGVSWYCCWRWWNALKQSRLE